MPVRTSGDLARFRSRVEALVHHHPVVVDNAYTRWFATGSADRDEVRHLTVQFSRVQPPVRRGAAPQGPERRRPRLLPGGQGDPDERAGRRVQAGPRRRLRGRGRGPRDRVDRRNGRRRALPVHRRPFRVAAPLRRPDRPRVRRLGKRRHGTPSTLFFCDELLRIYGSDDSSIAEGASYAVEHWAAAGFWKELIAGLTAFKARECPELPLGFWIWHDKIEDQHAAHTADELAEAFFRPDFDEQRFLAGAPRCSTASPPSGPGWRPIAWPTSSGGSHEPRPRASRPVDTGPAGAAPAAPRLGGIDHIEFWVGNARASAAFFASGLRVRDRGLRRPGDGRRATGCRTSSARATSGSW